jgi:hypothetical protein
VKQFEISHPWGKRPKKVQDVANGSYKVDSKQGMSLINVLRDKHVLQSIDQGRDAVL